MMTIYIEVKQWWVEFLIKLFISAIYQFSDIEMELRQYSPISI